MIASAQVSLQRFRPRQLAGPSERPSVITTISSQTTCRSEQGSVPAASRQRPGSIPTASRQHASSVPAASRQRPGDNLPVPASAQVSLQRVRPRQLAGPSKRPGVITTISSQTTCRVQTVSEWRAPAKHPAALARQCHWPIQAARGKASMLLCSNEVLFIMS